MAAIKFSRIRPIMACPKQYWAPLSAIAELARSVISSSRFISFGPCPAFLHTVGFLVPLMLGEEPDGN